MRNLKKFLALVMAMVMAFSLMLTVNAAASTNVQFGDSDQVTEAFKESVEILSGMKVIQGDSGDFRPGSNITRAEVAALIYRLATGDTGTEKMDLYTTTHPFTDVNASDWFAGYVGYCWNAGYIKGTTATTFNPYANVTGYEVLAMVLRAVGYDKQNEYTGGNWIVNVSATATQRGILDDVKSTHYGDTLHLASRRDVVASILFNAAIIPQVQYTPAFGYQTTGMSGGVIGTTDNPSLGYQNFQLKKATGAIVGNQDTGEKVSVLGVAGSKAYTDDNSVAKTATWTMYNYPGTVVVDGDNATPGKGTKDDQDIKVNNSQYFNWTTGIEEYGHKVDFWYKEQASKNNATSGQTVYAMFDRVKKSEVVWAPVDNTSYAVLARTDYDATKSGQTNQGTTANLGEAAVAAGFKVDLKSEQTANLVPNFNKLMEDYHTQAATASTINVSYVEAGSDTSGNCFMDAATVTNSTTVTTTSPDQAYLVISNNDELKPDVIVALTVEISQVRAVDNVGATKTVTVPGTNNVFNANHDNTDGHQGLLEQAALVGDSTKELKDYEVGVRIDGTVGGRTTTKTEKRWTKLVKVEDTVTGTVSAFKNHADPDKGSVTLSDGTVLKRSPLYNTVVGWSATTVIGDPKPSSILPQQWVKGAVNWEEGYVNQQYKFFLDKDGKYLGATPVTGNTFVYGTYLDYGTEIGSSTFKYSLVGVDLEGNIVKDQTVTAFEDTADGAGVHYRPHFKALNGTNELETPYRDAMTGTSLNGVGPGKYKGFIVSGTNVNSTMDTTTAAMPALADLGVYAGTDTKFDKASVTVDGVATSVGDIVIDKTATTLGAVSVNVANDLYLTESTKIILVSGIGTDSVKAQVYNGISELKGDSSYVILNMRNNVDNVGTGADFTNTEVRMPGIISDPNGTTPASGAKMNEMTYYTTSPFTYAQTGVRGNQADVIIMPAAAVERSNASNLYFVGDKTPTMVNAYGEDATKFTMYKDGEKVSVWIQGLTSAAASDAKTVATTDDQFYKLNNTGKTANDGEPIYSLIGTALTASAAPSEGGVIVNATYTAATYSAQTGTFTQSGTALTTPMRNVANAKVVNVNKDNSGVNVVFPDITDLTTLNYAGSLVAYGSGHKLTVSAVLNADDPLVVDVIYVHFVQPA